MAQGASGSLLYQHSGNQYVGGKSLSGGGGVWWISAPPFNYPNPFHILSDGDNMTVLVRNGLTVQIININQSPEWICLHQKWTPPGSSRRWHYRKKGELIDLTFFLSKWHFYIRPARPWNVKTEKDKLTVPSDLI